MALAVNCLVIEPIRHTEAGVIGVAVSRLAEPNPLENTTAPLRRTQTCRPGVILLAIISCAFASTAAHGEGGLATLAIAGEAASASNPASDDRRFQSIRPSDFTRVIMRHARAAVQLCSKDGRRPWLRTTSTPKRSAPPRACWTRS